MSLAYCNVQDQDHRAFKYTSDRRFLNSHSHPYAVNRSTHRPLKTCQKLDHIAGPGVFRQYQDRSESLNSGFSSVCNKLHLHGPQGPIIGGVKPLSGKGGRDVLRGDAEMSMRAKPLAFSPQAHLSNRISHAHDLDLWHGYAFATLFSNLDLRGRRSSFSRASQMPLLIEARSRIDLRQSV